MDNQYNYYTTNQEDLELNGNLQEPHEPHKRQKKGTPKWIKVGCLGLVFGLVASVVFQASNIVGNKLLGGLTSANSEKSSEAVNSAQLSVTSNSTVNSDVAGIVKEVMPSVVSITSMTIQQVQNFFGGVQEQESTSVGSGIIISKNDTELLIVTNNHVVSGSSTLTVTFVDDESVEANVKGTDASRDLAVIAIPLESIKDATMKKITVASLGDSTQLQVGEPAIAIGNALGYGQSVTTGIISATDRQLDTYEGALIQTDAAINPGNSGGALLNANGEVIGINSIKVATDVVEGMGYAIPISDASAIITDLMNQETKTKAAEGERGILGIEGYDVTADSAQMYSMPRGVYVANAVAGGGAEKAGIAKGMVITKVNDAPIDSMTTLKLQLEYYKVGDEITVTVQTPERGGEYKEDTVKVTLGENSGQ